MPDGLVAEGQARCANLCVFEKLGIATKDHGECERPPLRNARRIPHKRTTRVLGWRHTTHNPHGFARAARGRERLGYAGGSRRSPQPVHGGDPGSAGVFHRESFARDFGPGRKHHRRNDANYECHIPARQLDVVGKRIIIVIDGMTVAGAISVSVSNNLTVSPTGVLKCKVEIVVAGISSSGFRCGNEDTLERKGDRSHHHNDDGKPSKKRPPQEFQRSQSSMILIYIIWSRG